MVTESCKVRTGRMEEDAVLSVLKSDERSQSRGLTGVGALFDYGPQVKRVPDEEDVGDLSYKP